MKEDKIKFLTVIYLLAGSVLLLYGCYWFFVRHESVSVRFSNSGPFFVCAMSLLTMAWIGYCRRKE